MKRAKLTKELKDKVKPFLITTYHSIAADAGDCGNTDMAELILDADRPQMVGGMSKELADELSKCSFEACIKFVIKHTKKAYEVLDQSDNMRSTWCIAPSVTQAKSLVRKISKGRRGALIVYDINQNHITVDKERRHG